MKHLIVLIAFCFATTASAQAPSVPPVENLMDSETFRAAGLHKLDVDELAYLNAWLRIFAASVLSVYGDEGTSSPPTATTPPPPSSAAVIESRIDGTFEGWDGSTTFRLMNGQVWQQAEYSYHYHYAYMPRVLIVRSGGGYVMEVEGVRPTIRVHRLR